MIEQLGIRYWLDGGWGVDALVGRQTREHRDVDIDFDAACTEKLRQKLEEKGYIEYEGVRGSRKQTKSKLTPKGITFCRDIFRPQTI